MAFPFIFEDDFESGSNSGWTSETDTVSQLDFAHYSELARYPWPTALPFQGAYAARVVLSGGTADAFVTSTSVTLAAATTAWVKFSVWFSPTFTATANDTFSICELQSAGAVVEVSFGARIVAATNVINFGIGETVPATFGILEIRRGIWYTVELKVVLDSGGGNDGTVDCFVTAEDEPAATAVHMTQVATLDQAAITQVVLGIQDQLATTTGVMLIDGFVYDDARLFPRMRRYDDIVLLTKSGHAFVGPGTVQNVSLMSGGGTDNVVKVFDTDVADVNDAGSMVAELKNTANSELVDPAGMPVDVVRGCYVQLSGTNPRALVQMCNVTAYSNATVRRQGVNRKV